MARRTLQPKTPWHEARQAVVWPRAALVAAAKSEANLAEHLPAINALLAA